MIDAFMQRIGRVWRASNGAGEGWIIVETWAWDGKGGIAGAKSRQLSDPLLRGLVTGHECRRKYLNRIYGNPPTGEWFLYSYALASLSHIIIQNTYLITQNAAIFAIPNQPPDSYIPRYLLRQCRQELRLYLANRIPIC